MLTHRATDSLTARNLRHYKRGIRDVCATSGLIGVQCVTPHDLAAVKT